MSTNWKALLATVAPTLATALGGPLAGIAARAITNKLAGRDPIGDTDVQQIITGATPADLSKLRESEREFLRDMAAAGVDLERIDAGDRDSARKRQIDIGDKAPTRLAVVVVTGFFLVLAAMMFVDIPEQAQQPLNILLGALTGLLLQVGNYFYGSSSGSARKNEMINAMMAKINGGSGAI